MELSNVQLVVIAVYELGGETKAVDVEDIAVTAYQSNPNKFAWKKYPDMIDKGVVQYALKDASIPKNGFPLLAGSIKHGYLLTSSGSDWVKGYLINSQQIKDPGFRSKSTSEKLVLERTRLETSAAYTKFRSGELDNITEADFQDFTRVNEYFPEHARIRRFTIIESVTQGYPDLESCWQYFKQRFG